MSRRQTSQQPEPATRGLRAVLYARVSVSNGSDSLDAQLEACREWAAEQGFEVVAEHVDDGISGAKGDDERAGLASALALIEDGAAEGVVCHRADRLARQLHLSEAILARVWAAGGRVFCVDGGEIIEDDSSDPMRVFCRQVLAAAAQLERGLIIARMQGGRRRARAAGRHIGGTRPFGYDVREDGQLVEREDEQATIRRLRELRAKGLGLRAIGREVRLHPEQVRRILARKKEST